MFLSGIYLDFLIYFPKSKADYLLAISYQRKEDKFFP